MRRGREETLVWMKYLVAGMGGFLGANARFIVGTWIGQKWGTAFPYGTLVINVTGCFILGLFAALAERFPLSDTWRLLIAIGFVGAYTTFSTFEYETLQLVRHASLRFAGLNILGSVLLGYAAAYGGMVAARLLTRAPI